MVFHTIGTHRGPHFEEHVTIELLRMFGERMFPGISTAKVAFFGNGGILPEGKTAADYEREGILLIGTGGGRFDEHPSGKSERKENHCTATLVAEALGVQEDPGLEKILKAALNNDLKGAASPFDLAYILKLLWEQHSDEPDMIFSWFHTAFAAKYEEQASFFGTTKKEFDEHAKVSVIFGPRGESLRVIAIETENPQMGKFARWEGGGDAAVVIQKNKAGNVVILTNQKKGIRMHEVARIIRVEEQRAKGVRETTDWRELEGEGRVKGAEEWWLQIATQAIMNGSLTAPEVPPTKLSIGKIISCVETGLSKDSFHTSRSEECLKGVCTSTMKNQCPWYDYGLSRCKKIRFEAKAAKAR